MRYYATGTRIWSLKQNSVKYTLSTQENFIARQFFIENSKILK